MILITGGAGYIGSHTVRELIKAGYEILVLDDLSRGHRAAVPDEIPLVVGSVGDERLLNEVFDTYRIEAVMHFAAESLVGESMQDPGKYFRRNVGHTSVLLDCCAKKGIKHFVFSSSAAVYGEPKTVPINEDMLPAPTNVYGQTKMMIEEMLTWYDRIYGMKYVALRYFNAAGADYSGEIGEDHVPETHLIPLIMQTALGMRGPLTIFGNDYPTEDGTCIRDYIHVTDLAKAHVLALKYLREEGRSAVYNLGSGKGYSVSEIIKTVEEVTGGRVPFKIGPRRPGDPAVLTADAELVKRELGWDPRYGLQEIIETAWKWHKSHPHGYMK